MKRIYLISLFLLVCMIPALAASEAEYNKLSKTYILNSDGSQEFRYSMELTLFTHAAMNRTYGESFIIYNPVYQELKIHTSYTKQKDGTIIRTPENAFVEVLPRQAAEAPAFNNLKEMVVVHTGLELGATIYLDYSIISKPGYLPELDISDAIELASPVKDYTITIKAPENKPLFYDLSNSAVKPVVKISNGVKEVTWKMRNLPAVSRAPQASAMGGNIILLTVSGFASNDEAMMYLNKQLTSSGNTSVTNLLRTIIKDKNTNTEKLYAILNHVIDNVDFIGLPLKETGFRLRSVDEITASAYATEAEKINLLAFLLNAAGIKSEVAAAYFNNSNINSCGLSAVNELFVITIADGKQYMLTPKRKNMSEAGWYAGYAKFACVSNPDKTITIETPSIELDYRYLISLEPEKAEINVAATVGKSFIPYTDNYSTTYMANDKNGKEEKGDVFSTFSYSTSQQFNNIDKYIIFSLPDSPNSLSHASYKNYNSKRSEHLLLPYKAKESFKYTINLPDNMELKTHASTKTIDNNAGKTTISIKQTGNMVEVTRTLEIKKQLISPADYSAFRTIMIEWAGNNQLLFYAD